MKTEAGTSPARASERVITRDFEIGKAATGAALHQGAIAIDGIPVVVSALAVRGNEIVVGTIDGRLALFELRRLHE